MKRSTDRILTTHVGSLIKPLEIRDVMAKIETGQPYDAAAFELTLKREVAAVVKQQAETGIDVIDDGEYSKVSWFGYLEERLGGLELRDMRPGEENPSIKSIAPEVKDFPEFYEAYFQIMQYDWLPPGQTKTRIPRPAEQAGPAKVWDFCGPLSYTGHDILKRDLDNLEAATGALNGLGVEEAFVPVAAPMSARGNFFNSYFENEDELFAQIADALKEEYKAIVDAGFLIQVDDAFLAHEYDRLLREMDEKQVIKHCEMCVELLNAALEGIPEDRVRYHVCWGSWAGPHVSDIPLKKLAGMVLNVKAQAYSLEAANPRHEHEWQVWKDVKLPDGKILIPGVVTHSTNVVEHPELVALRIKNFASVVGKENVIAGTDCGFAQGHRVARVHPSVQWAKLEAMVEGAKLASRELWAN
jgi:5-methyltetrahydropteroyltriglutamate--homocysteine methyltransferase